MNALSLAAFCATLFAGEGFAFVARSDGLGAVQRWYLFSSSSNAGTNLINTNTHAIRYFLSSDGFSATNTAAELDAVRAAFDQWQSVPGTILKFEDAGPVSPPVDINTADNTNLVYWATDSLWVNGGMDYIGGALGVTFDRVNVTNNTLLESDIVFNGVERSWFTDFSDDTNPGYFVESVALHEIGHFIGLNHSPLGAATMFASSASGVGTQAGLSTDEISAVRFLYPENADDYAALTGVVTKDGNSVLGAAVYVHNAAGTILSGTVTESDGRFLVGALPPDTYEIRVSPLDPASATTFLSKGSSIATNFAAADTSFLPTTSVSVTVTAGATNVVNLSVANSSPPFRITRIRAPVAVSNQFTIVGTGVTLEAGQSNYYIGVASATLPANSATLTITGDGLTLGSALFHPNLFGSGLNFISVPVSVASNATPGLRSLIVQQGANLAVAAGFLEILPALLDYNFDGLDDAFQRTYFSPFTSSNAAPGMDADFDAMSNAAEFVAGTIPTNALSLLKMLSPTNGQDGLAVRWESVAGRRYQVSHRTNEMTGNWQDIGAPVTAIGSTTTFVDDSAASETLLYRVRIVP